MKNKIDYLLTKLDLLIVIVLIGKENYKYLLDYLNDYINCIKIDFSIKNKIKERLSFNKN